MLTIKAACVWLRLRRRSCRSCEPALTFPLLYPPRSPLRLTLIFVIFALPHMLFEKDPADYTKARVTLYFWSNLTIKSIKPRCIFCRLDYGSFLHQLLSEPTVILWQWQLKASVDHVCYYTGNFQTCKRKTLHCDATEDRVILKDDNI